ncbi:MAG TPA: hybrid sensor histidine kinase/response regulator [Deltaproteobacteria bacterium]|nr:hybrid sensor histidine kinase/response regulator [Deltaproteobacteria bacterium]HDZ91049.1 hybrid sensor histidine kinase/response regulator [Deltaproteobacteria bacterium]
MDEEELLKKLREAFRAEAGERLASMSSGLLELEKIPDPDKLPPILEVVFREAHSLKGAARSVNLTDIETLCQAMEGVFAAMKRDEISLSEGLFDLLHQCVRAVEDSLAALEGEGTGPTEVISTLVSTLEGVREGEEAKIPHGLSKKERELRKKDAVPPEREDAPKHAPDREDTTEEEPVPVPGVSQNIPETPVRTVSPESVRISTAKLDSLFLKVEELVSLKLSSAEHVADLKAVVQGMQDWTKRWRGIEEGLKRAGSTTLKGNGSDRLMAFLQWNQGFIGSLEKGLSGLVKGAEQRGRSLGLMVDDLLDDMKRVTMLPFSTLLNIFPRMIREISRDQGKEVELQIKGGEVEIDRRILEEMRDPITHLLRNSVDHGLEAPEDRERQGKPRRGSIRLIVSQTEGGKAGIIISDDGAGIDLAQVKNKALSLGIITEQDMDRLSEREALSLILESGISTSPIITEISGRGLGLAIVQEKVERLGGHLIIDTTPGRGTSFRIELPVTIATFRGILVRVGESSFILPSISVERTLRVHPDEIRTVENRPTIPLNGKALSLLDLARVLGLNQGGYLEEENGFLTVVVLGTGERRIGFRVDQVLGEQEVLVKGLGKQLRHVRKISGATILGSGRVVPILNVQELLTSPPETALQARESRVDHEKERKKSILIAEDSITSRMLLKSILEAAGYSVRTAVDGSEAYTTLKTGEFDLVVSDVEMPRLDGFGLTRKIRADKKYADIPVILVTGLETQEDKERGIDAGANAYIVKSSFDQSNLLEIVRRMI